MVHVNDTSSSVLDRTPEGVDASAPEMSNTLAAAVGDVDSSAASDRLVRVPKRRIRRYVRRHWKGLLAAMVLIVGPPTYSYVGYLTAPGSASNGERTVDWVRDHGGDGIVNRVEQWWYTRKPPGNGSPPGAVLPSIPAPVPARGATVSGDVANPAPIDLRALSTEPLPGEGVWIPGEQSIDGTPVLYTTFLRPDPGNTSVVAGIVEFDQNLVRTVAVPGTKEPGGSGWAWNSKIPIGERSTLLAAFNSGFKFRHIDGGYSTEGRTPEALADGHASVVIDLTGRIDIGSWGTDVLMNPGVVTVRQNLHLIVDKGQIVPDLKSDRTGKYGKPRHQLQFTWRSGIGVTANGNLVYVAGDKMTMSALANALQQAGVVRGMQLDIHTKQVTALLFAPVDGTSTGVHATKLLPKIPNPDSRFLKTDQRDFFAVFVR